MEHIFNLEEFINKYVTKRPSSMFEQDIFLNRENLKKAIKDKSVLVIGGAGTIGSSFIYAILPFEPSELYIVDVNENALTELTRDVRSSAIFVPKIYVPYPMDYDAVTFKRFFKHHKGFDIVANFSAHKHVRSEKDIYSIEALLRNNVINVKSLLDLLIEYPPQTYFCVSTDKAANPVNIMGASKRIMEDLIFSYSDNFSVKTARFANVAFSNGSLPAGFLDRISKLQPLSAPLDVKRYFVSPEESGQICMLAAILGNNREIYYPKLREAQMMRFDTIAEELLQQHGFEIKYFDNDEDAIKWSKRLKNGEKDYPVYFSESDTFGEKLYEEFFTIDESTDEDRYQALGVIINKPIPDRNKIKNLLDDLSRAFESNNISKDEVVQILASYLDNFKHIEKAKSLDQKM